MCHPIQIERDTIATDTEGTVERGGPYTPPLYGGGPYSPLRDRSVPTPPTGGVRTPPYGTVIDSEIRQNPV